MSKHKCSKFIIFLSFLMLVVLLVFGKGSLKLSPANRIYSEHTPSSHLIGENQNIVLVTIDTLRADHLQCYGYAKDISPHIDKLAEEGVLFLNTISQASTTPVSHASILTGVYPYHHGLRYLHGGHHYRLKDTVTTLAEILQGNAYRTAAFVSAFPLISKRYNLNKGFEWYDEDFTIDENTVNCPLCRMKGLFNTGKSQRRSDETNKKVFKWLEAHHQKKFFIWVHYFDPHDAIVKPPEEFLQKFPEVRDTGDQSIEMYDVDIAYSDYQFGELWKKIKNLGIDKNTLFILTSDHGQGLYDHNYWSHAEKLYQEQIRVPMIIRHSKLQGNRKVSGITRTVDIVPTILDLLCVSLSGYQFDGTSLLPYIIEDTPLPDLIAYSETHYPKILKNDSPLLSVTDRQWKFIYYSEREAMNQLFDLKRDPKEHINLIKKNPELAQKLKDYLKEEKVFVEEDTVPKTGSIETDVLEKLKSLGYFNDSGRNGQ